ncbi:MAG: hypothetical protein ACI399_00655 [Candidatus Cryptobacteroides sp.]
MKSPFTGGNVIKKSKSETFRFRNEEYTVTAYYFECVDTGKTFTNAELDDQLMEDVYCQYRKRHGIPSPSALKQLRERYGLSAHAMSKIACIGINQYGLYENGEMPTLVVGQRLASLFEKASLLKSIDAAGHRLGKDYLKVKKKVEEYAEPQVFNLRRDYYPQFDEAVSPGCHSVAYPCRKARWTTCSC